MHLKILRHQNCFAGTSLFRTGCVTMVQEDRGKTSNKKDTVDFFVAKLWQMSLQCWDDHCPLAYPFHAMIQIYLWSLLDLVENQIGSGNWLCPWPWPECLFSGILLWSIIALVTPTSNCHLNSNSLFVMTPKYSNPDYQVCSLTSVGALVLIFRKRDDLWECKSWSGTCKVFFSVKEVPPLTSRHIGNFL